jgi:hypothetical protein
MNLNSTHQAKLNMLLTQMGAKVTIVHGIFFYVKFIIKEMEVLYIFNLNAKNQYYLQRILPYPIGAGAFPTPDQVIDFIRKDIQKLQNASQSKKFNDFIIASTQLHHIVHGLEDLFLNYNVPLSQMTALEKAIAEVNALITQAKERCQPLATNSSQGTVL